MATIFYVCIMWPVNQSTKTGNEAHPHVLEYSIIIASGNDKIHNNWRI